MKYQCFIFSPVSMQPLECQASMTRNQRSKYSWRNFFLREILVKWETWFRDIFSGFKMRCLHRHSWVMTVVLWALREHCYVKACSFYINVPLSERHASVCWLQPENPISPWLEVSLWQSQGTCDLFHCLAGTIRQSGGGVLYNMWYYCSLQAVVYVLDFCNERLESHMDFEFLFCCF